MNYKVTHYPTRQRFEIELESMKAYAEYRLTDNSLDIIHTFVPPALEGRGIASALTEAAYDYAKANHLKPEGTCSYAAVWLKRHPEYLQEKHYSSLLADTSSGVPPVTRT